MLERQKKNLRKIEETSPSKFEAFIVKVIYVILFIAYNLFEIWLVYLIGIPLQLIIIFATILSYIRHRTKV